MIIKKKLITFVGILVLISMAISGCSVQKNKMNISISKNYFLMYAEKYNLNSYNYQFTQEEGISLDGAISYVIANYDDFINLSHSAIDYGDDLHFLFPKINFEKEINAAFNTNKEDYSCRYFDKNNNCYVLPIVKNIQNSNKTIIEEVTQQSENRYIFTTVVSAFSKYSGKNENTIKQKFFVETDGENFKFISVKKEWELPGFYTDTFSCSPISTDTCS